MNAGRFVAGAIDTAGNVIGSISRALGERFAGYAGTAEKEVNGAGETVRGKTKQQLPQRLGV